MLLALAAMQIDNPWRHQSRGIKMWLVHWKRFQNGFWCQLTAAFVRHTSARTTNHMTPALDEPGHFLYPPPV